MILKNFWGHEFSTIENEQKQTVTWSCHCGREDLGIERTGGQVNIASMVSRVVTYTLWNFPYHRGHPARDSQSPATYRAEAGLFSGNSLQSFLSVAIRRLSQ